MIYNSGSSCKCLRYRQQQNTLYPKGGRSAPMKLSLFIVVACTSILLIINVESQNKKSLTENTLYESNINSKSLHQLWGFNFFHNKQILMIALTPPPQFYNYLRGPNLNCQILITKPIFMVASVLHKSKKSLLLASSFCR